jgi:hypothetical protein
MCLRQKRAYFRILPPYDLKAVSPIPVRDLYLLSHICRACGGKKIPSPEDTQHPSIYRAETPAPHPPASHTRPTPLTRYPHPLRSCRPPHCAQSLLSPHWARWRRHPMSWRVALRPRPQRRRLVRRRVRRLPRAPLAWVAPAQAPAPRASGGAIPGGGGGRGWLGLVGAGWGGRGE